MKSLSAPEGGAIGTPGALIRRELLLAARTPLDTLMPLLFFAVVVLLFPLAVGPDQARLATIGAGAIWIATLLAAVLSMTRLFRADAESGFIDQLRVEGSSLTVMVMVKVAGHWLFVGAPLLLLVPLVASPLGLDNAQIPDLVATVALGSATLFLLGAAVESLALSSRGGGILMALLLLPLCIPVMIFGTTAIQAKQIGMTTAPHLSMLAGLFLLAASLCPPASAAALRISLD